MNNRNVVDWEYMTPEDLERAKLQYARYFTRHKRARKINRDFKADVLADEGRKHGNAKEFLRFKREKLAKQENK